MKRRRNLLVALLLVCAMGIGVGYAAVSGTLNVNANVEVEKTEFEVVFTNAVMTATAKTSTRQATLEAACDKGLADGAKSDTVTPTFGGLLEAGDTVTITYTVTNESNVEVELEDLTFTTDLTPEQKDYINVEVDTLAGNLTPGATKTVDVTVTLKKVSETDLTPTFVLKANTKVLNDVTP